MDLTTLPASEPSDQPKPKLRWFQYSPRTLLVFMFLVAVGLSWFAVKLQQARRQGEAVKTLRTLGAEVKYDPRTLQAAVPTWSRELLGDDFFGRVAFVSCDGRQQVTDAGLEQLEAATRDCAALEKNFREKFETLNHVHLTDGEFQRLLDEIVTPDVFTAAHTLRNRNSFARDDGIRAGYQQSKDEKHAAELAAAAQKHGLPPELLQTFVDNILSRMIFDGEQLTELLSPLELGWRAGGRDISGLRAYEE